MSFPNAFVATLIAHPATMDLTEELALRAAALVNAPAVDWLGLNIACDLPLPEGSDPTSTLEGLRTLFTDLPIDVVVQEAARRRKKLLIADMDSTMIEQECIDELADELGIKDQVAGITARAMNGEIAFEPALRERVALLKGLPVDSIDDIIARRITFMSGGKALVATMRANGAYTALVSGGFTLFTARIGAALGFDENRANTLIIDGDRLTGMVEEPILGRVAKAQSLAEIAGKLGIEVGDAMAVGDGANDLDMIGLAGSGVALHAKPSVAAAARMQINHGDLTALLYIQGYRQSEFA
ncbi:phosphoserine phosphatase SerB [Limoniibacter endophyticus]|nr:phosphoserine phosphatase SerB [Limoniibacter endophyticus]